MTKKINPEIKELADKADLIISPALMGRFFYFS